MNGFQESLTCEGAPAVNPIILTELKKRDQTNEVPYGYCKCGCGQKTKICTHTDRRLSDHVLGEPQDFIRGHAISGFRHPRWVGGRRIDKDGYVMIYSPEHPNKSSHNCVPEHVLVCEKVLGKHLPPLAVVHHVDKKKANNAPFNLVICQDNTYHLLLHMRKRAYEACGHVDWRRCRYCKQYGDPKDMVLRSYNNHSYADHIECSRADQRRRKKLKQNKILINERGNG